MALPCGYVKNGLVIPTLAHLKMVSDASVNLMMGTTAIESDFGSFRTQLVTDYAKGICQIEPPTYDDIWRYLDTRQDIRDLVLSIVPCGTIPPIQFLEMEAGDILSIALARIKYWMIPEALPPADMIGALGSYYAQYYNAGGKGTAENFVKKYYEYVTC